MIKSVFRKIRIPIRNIFIMCVCYNVKYKKINVFDDKISNCFCENWKIIFYKNIGELVLSKSTFQPIIFFKKVVFKFIKQFYTAFQ